jgi:hypothetical protein
MPEGRDLYRDGHARADRSYNYVSAGTEGQWEDRRKAADEAEANAREQTGFTGHVGINEFLGMGTHQGNAVGRSRQEAGAEPKPKPDAGHIGINEYLGLGSPEGNRIAAEHQAKGSKYVDEGTEGMWEGVGQVVTGAANIAFDPLVIAGSAGYYAGKKGLLDKVGRGKKGPPDNPDYRPDDPLR